MTSVKLIVCQVDWLKLHELAYFSIRTRLEKEQAAPI